MTTHPRALRHLIAAGSAIAVVALLLGGCTTDSEPESSPHSNGGVASVLPGVALSPVRLSTPAGIDAGAADGHSLNLPAGWRAEVWANVPGARMAVWTPDDRLIVSAAQQGTLALLTPRTSGSGATVTTLLDGLENPQGVAIERRGDGAVLVVGEETRIVAWDYSDGRVTNRRVLVDDLPGGGHGAKMVDTHDGVVVYNVGSATNRDASDRTSTPQRGTIARVNLDGSGKKTIAVGVRNGEGLSFAPDGTLFAAINQADNQPYPLRDDSGRYGQTVREYVNEHPNDQVSRITAGTDMGWPYCVPDSRGHKSLTNLGYINDPTSNPRGDALDCGAIGRTQLGLPAHSAPVGFVFTQGSDLPAALANGALVTAHGSWNRQPPREPYVAYTAWNPTSKTLGPAQAIVAGFQNPDGSRWGRSVDAVPGPDGSLYLTDDTAGLVYRLTP
jgi:glucose/arabinose dehydrogenase